MFSSLWRTSKTGWWWFILFWITLPKRDRWIVGHPLPSPSSTHPSSKLSYPIQWEPCYSFLFRKCNMLPPLLLSPGLVISYFFFSFLFSHFDIKKMNLPFNNIFLIKLEVVVNSWNPFNSLIDWYGNINKTKKKKTGNPCSISGSGCIISLYILFFTSRFCWFCCWLVGFSFVQLLTNKTTER